MCLSCCWLFGGALPCSPTHCHINTHFSVFFKHKPLYSTQPHGRRLTQPSRSPAVPPHFTFELNPCPRQCAHHNLEGTVDARNQFPPPPQCCRAITPPEPRPCVWCLTLWKLWMRDTFWKALFCSSTVTVWVNVTILCGLSQRGVSCLMNECVLAGRRS